MRCGEIFRNDMRGAASSAKVSCGREQRRHEARGAEGSHSNAESFLRAHSAMQNVEILLFAESVTGSREGMGAV